jgi:hypothetical protein
MEGQCSGKGGGKGVPPHLSDKKVILAPLSTPLFNFYLYLLFLKPELKGIGWKSFLNGSR